MRRILSVAVITILLSGTSAFAGEYSGYLMDKMCSMKMKSKDKAAMHTKQCALNCAESGFGLVTDDGEFLMFDEKGSAKAKKALEASNKEKNLLAKVKGKKDGNTIKVKSITLQ